MFFVGEGGRGERGVRAGELGQLLNRSMSKVFPAVVVCM